MKKTKQNRTGDRGLDCFPFKNVSWEASLGLPCASHKCNSSSPFKFSVMLHNAMKPVLPKQNPSCHPRQCPLHLFPPTHHQDMLFLLQISFLLAFSPLLFLSSDPYLTITLCSFNSSLSLLSYRTSLSSPFISIL